LKFNLNAGVPRETAEYERRVALSPAGVAALAKAGFSVNVERDAGAFARFSVRLSMLCSPCCALYVHVAKMCCDSDADASFRTVVCALLSVNDSVIPLET
jgi:hypothetical protein